MSRRVDAVRRGFEVLMAIERCQLPKGTTAERRSRLWRRMRRKAYRREWEALRLVTIEVLREALERERQELVS
jgi:hypothetical protein